MPAKRPMFVCVFAVCALAVPTLQADQMVPFKGTWAGVTVSADGTNFPVVQIVAEGRGHITHLGAAGMVSPHTTNVFTGETLGEQIFTAANGDTLTAYCEGSPGPQPDGTVAGTLDCTFTSGTGRFEGASGGYTFSLVATPLPGGQDGFATVAEIEGSISSVGSSR